jgi:predicted NBD/HSP70 family sugar kinase
MAGETPGSQSALREANQRRLLRAISSAGSMTQAQIARTTGLSAATVSNIVRELRDLGMVTVSPTSSGGRRAQSVSLARGTGLAVGVHVTASHLRAAICDMAYDVLVEERIPYDVTQSPERGIRRAEWLVATLIRQARVDRTKIRGIGVAVPGPIEERTGRLGAGTVLATWQGVDIAAELSRRVGMRVQVANDAHAAALGESIWGAGRDIPDLAYLKLSSSVGAALVINGKVYKGYGGLAGEFGHITVNEQGRICRCGNRGCLETVVGGPYLLELLPVDPGQPRPSLERLVAAAIDGELGSRRVIADAGRAVGAAAAVLCNLLNPQRLVVGGELAGAGDLLLAPIREALVRQALPAAVRMVEVVPAELAGSAAVRGALAAVVRSATPLGDAERPA